ATFVYWLVTYRHYAIVRRGQANWTDFWFGVVAIAILFEIGRRVLGRVIPILALVFMLQLYFGPDLPGVFAHRGFSIFRIVDFMYRTEQAIFGTIAGTFSTYVLPFILLGAFMETSGAGEFFIRRALSLTKGWAGGPAKVAVMASAVFGSISGSSVANVVSTGTFTIPMMKRVGFKSEDAGAIEAAASTGGQMLPPVMGAGAFLLATLTETPYIRIAVMNIIPALLYYWWCLCSVHFNARKYNIGNIPDEEIPSKRETIKEGWFFIIPILAIFFVLAIGQAPDRAAFVAIVLLIGLSWFTKTSKMRLKELAGGLESGGISNVSVGGTIGLLGIVMGGIVLSGLAQKFGVVIVSLSGGNMFLAITLVGLVGVIIGMGATQTATYILMSLIVVPGLVTLGMNVVIANIIAFWFSAVSNVTPPVCVSAFAAASIAEADPMKTGYRGVIYSFMLFVLPFSFYYMPELLLQGATAWNTVYATACLVLATVMVAGGVMGFFFRDIKNNLVRVALVAGGLMVFIPEVWSDVTGLAVGAAVLAYQLLGSKSRSLKAA
ncbi:MAG TPA: TRAP transporter fused permease subunit, partial [Candidatus Limnocylindria bacterium]|nr:TRAP transporter fused permease subunit [Candidatus Limnocylindria bacterium]